VATTPATETRPAALPDEVGLIKKLIPHHDTDTVTFSAASGKASRKRQEKIEGILETLRGGLGLL
jgi:hypothetical protein